MTEGDGSVVEFVARGHKGRQLAKDQQMFAFHSRILKNINRQIKF